MRKLIVSFLIVAAAFASALPASAASVKLHSARVMVGHVPGPNGGYYEVKMNGSSYAMMPMQTFERLEKGYARDR